MKLVKRAYIFIGRHPKLNYILMCMKHINDKQFIYNVLGRNPQKVSFQNYGAEYPDKIIYLIEIGTKGDGFFAEYRRMLDYLYYAEEHALIPYVYVNEKFEYIDYREKREFYNYFDKFFVQYCNLDFNNVLKSKTVINAEQSHANLVTKLKGDSAYSVSDEYLEIIAKVACKYINFNENILTYVDDSLAEIGFSSDIIGVHVRGSDYKRGYKGHPIYISPEEFLEKTISVMKETGYKRVFLASDDIDTIRLFEKTLGNQVVSYNDVHRTDKNISVINLKSNENHYKSNLAKEVIRDMLTLSKCRILIAGMSQVSICARISNLAWEKEYERVIILNKGINKKGHSYLG